MYSGANVRTVLPKWRRLIRAETSVISGSRSAAAGLMKCRKSVNLCSACDSERFTCSGFTLLM